MQITNKILKFKILLGLHAGAELDLPSGEYTVGSHTDSDIVLNEEEVFPFHFKLKINEEIIEIIPQEGIVYIDGEKLDKGTHSLGLLQPFRVGRCICCIANIEEENWPDPYKSFKYQESSLAESKEIKDDIKEERNEEENVEKTLKEKEDQQEEVADTETERSLDTKLKKQFLIGGIILFLFFCGIFYFLFPTSKNVENLNKKETLEEFLKKNKFVNLKIKKGPKRTEVIGIVKDINTKMDLISKIRAKYPNVVANIMSKDEIAMGIKDIFESYHAKGVKFDLKDNGVLILNGFVPSSSIIAKVIKSIRHDMNNMLKIENNVLSGDEIKQKIMQTFLSQKIKGKINLQFNSSGIKVVALISRRDTFKFNKVMKLLKEEYGDKLKLSSEVKYLEDRVRLDIKGIYIGTVKYIIWTDGKKYFEGSKLPSGFVLKGIDFNKVELEKGNLRLSIPIGGE